MGFCSCMRVLFITSTRLGDAVLSTGLLRHITDTYKNARITVACGALGADLFAAIPQVEAVHVMRKQRFNGHWLALLRKVALTRWDMVVDLRNSAISRVLWAQQKFIMGPHIDKTRHKVEQLAQVMRLSYTPAPKLWVTEAARAEAWKYVPNGAPVLAIGPAANWPAKTWQLEKFIHLLQTPALQAYRLAVLAAPAERAQVLPLLQHFPNAIDLVGVGTPLIAAACLERCALFVGNDSGLMHMAAALGVPTIGLFGPTRDDWYRPWGAHATFIRTTESFADLMLRAGKDLDTAPCLMTSLSVEAVSQKVLAQIPATEKTPRTAQSL